MTLQEAGMEWNQIQFQVENHTGTITLNTPRNFNALDHEKYAEIQRALEICREDNGVRAVILRANGKAFSGGGDIDDMKRGVDSNSFDTNTLCMDSLRIVQTLRTLPKPVVAAVHGAAAGSGFLISLSCDILIAEESAKFYLPFVNIGLIPDASGMYTLTRVLGTNRAVAKAMMGEFYTAQEGVELGFVYRCCAKGTLDKEVADVTQKLVNGPTKAYAGLKKLAYISQFLAASYEEYIPHEIAMQTQMSMTEDFYEGITAFLEKRQASFRGT